MFNFRYKLCYFNTINILTRLVHKYQEILYAKLKKNKQTTLNLVYYWGCYQWHVENWKCHMLSSLELFISQHIYFVLNEYVFVPSCLFYLLLLVCPWLNSLSQVGMVHLKNVQCNLFILPFANTTIEGNTPQKERAGKVFRCWAHYILWFLC